MTLFGGPIINKTGIKWSCIIAAIAMPLAGSGYYVQARFKVDPYLLTARVCRNNGYMIQLTSRPLEASLAAFYTLRKRLQCCPTLIPMTVGSTSVSGRPCETRERSLVVPSTLPTTARTKRQGVLLGQPISSLSVLVSEHLPHHFADQAECSGVIWAALLSPTRKVRRSDATPVPTSGDLSWAKEFHALWKHLLHPRVCLLGRTAANESDMVDVHPCLLLLLLWRCHGNVSQSSLQCPLESIILFLVP